MSRRTRREGRSWVTLAPTAATVSALAFACTVYYVDGWTTAGAVNNVAITGLLIADFAFFDAAGDAQAAPSGITDNGDGSYTFVFAALETGTFNLVTPSSITDGLNIISGGAGTVTVP